MIVRAFASPKNGLALMLPLLCTLLAVGLTTPAARGAEPALVPLRPVPFTDVRITDTFWAPRRETNRIASLPVNLENLEKAGNLQNLRLAAQKATNGFRGPDRKSVV